MLSPQVPIQVRCAKPADEKVESGAARLRLRRLGTLQFVFELSNRGARLRDAALRFSQSLDRSVMKSSEFGEPLLEADASFFLDVHAPLFVVMSGKQHGRDCRSDRASDQYGSIASTNLFYAVARTSLANSGLMPNTPHFRDRQCDRAQNKGQLRNHR